MGIEKDSVKKSTEARRENMDQLENFLVNVNMFLCSYLILTVALSVDTQICGISVDIYIQRLEP